ncbi:MAG: tyrosine-protein kinase family protein [bacterium]
MGEISKALERARNDDLSARGAGAHSARRELHPLDERVEARDADSDPGHRAGRAAPSLLEELRAEHAADVAPAPDTGESPPPEAFHTIPRGREADWAARVVLVDPGSPHAGRFRHLAVRLRAELDRRSNPSLLVTSAVQGEGKTTVSVNLALAMASFAPEYRIALVDLDLHRANIARALSVSPERGIESVIRGLHTLDEVCIRTDLPALDLYPVARCEAEAYKLLGGASVARTLQELTRRYDYVILDGPPVLPVPDVPLYAPLVGGCLGVVRCGVTRRKNFREMVDLLPSQVMIGAFLNESFARKSGGAYAYRYETDRQSAEEES